MILEIIFLKKVSFSGVAPDLAGVVWNGAALCNGGMLSGQILILIVLLVMLKMEL